MRGFNWRSSWPTRRSLARLRQRGPMRPRAGRDILGGLAARHGAALAVMGGGGMLLFSEAPMDAPRRVFRLIQLSGDWYWRLDIMRDDGLIGPFVSRDEAEKDARETLGTREGDR
jgi:hypothetical protein